MPTRGVAHADEAAAMGALRAEVSDLHGQLAEKARDIEELESMLRVEITQGLQNIKDSEAMAAQVEERDREIADLRAQLSSSGPGRGGPGVGAGGRRGKATAQLEDKHRKTEAELLRTKQLHSEAKEQAKKAEAEARRHKKKASEFKAELKDAAAERDAAQEALQREKQAQSDAKSSDSVLRRKLDEARRKLDELRVERDLANGEVTSVRHHSEKQAQQLRDQQDQQREREQQHQQMKKGRDEASRKLQEATKKLDEMRMAAAEKLMSKTKQVAKQKAFSSWGEAFHQRIEEQEAAAEAEAQAAAATAITSQRGSPTRISPRGGVFPTSGAQSPLLDPDPEGAPEKPWLAGVWRATNGASSTGAPFKEYFVLYQSEDGQLLSGANVFEGEAGVFGAQGRDGGAAAEFEGRVVGGGRIELVQSAGGASQSTEWVGQMSPDEDGVMIGTWHVVRPGAGAVQTGLPDSFRATRLPRAPFQLQLELAAPTVSMAQAAAADDAVRRKIQETIAEVLSEDDEGVAPDPIVAGVVRGVHVGPLADEVGLVRATLEFFPPTLRTARAVSALVQQRLRPVVERGAQFEGLVSRQLAGGFELPPADPSSPHSPARTAAADSTARGDDGGANSPPGAWRSMSEFVTSAGKTAIAAMSDISAIPPGAKPWGLGSPVAPHASAARDARGYGASSPSARRRRSPSPRPAIGSSLTSPPRRAQSPRHAGAASSPTAGGTVRFAGESEFQSPGLGEITARRGGASSPRRPRARSPRGDGVAAAADEAAQQARRIFALKVGGHSSLGAEYDRWLLELIQGEQRDHEQRVREQRAHGTQVDLVRLAQCVRASWIRTSRKGEGRLQQAKEFFQVYFRERPQSEEWWDRILRPETVWYGRYLVSDVFKMDRGSFNGTYLPTRDEGGEVYLENGFPSYRNEFGKFLYRSKDGRWVFSGQYNPTVDRPTGIAAMPMYGAGPVPLGQKRWQGKPPPPNEERLKTVKVTVTELAHKPGFFDRPHSFARRKLVVRSEPTFGPCILAYSDEYARRRANSAVDQYGAVQLSEPLSEEYQSFEVEITKTKEGGVSEIGVGLAYSFSEGEAHHHGSDDLHPGWSPGSVGFHCDNGTLYEGQQRGGSKVGHPCKKGDKVSCGLVRSGGGAAAAAQQVEVWFAINGAHVATAMLECPDANPSFAPHIYPTVTLSGPDDEARVLLVKNASYTQSMSGGEPAPTPLVTEQFEKSPFGQQLCFGVHRGRAPLFYVSKIDDPHDSLRRKGMVEGLVLRTINDINVTDLVEDELAYSDEPLHGSVLSTKTTQLLELLKRAIERQQSKRKSGVGTALRLGFRDRFDTVGVVGHPHDATEDPRYTPISPGSVVSTLPGESTADIQAAKARGDDATARRLLEVQHDRSWVEANKWGHMDRWLDSARHNSAAKHATKRQIF